MKKLTALLLSFFMIFTLFSQTVCYAEPMNMETINLCKPETNLDEFKISKDISLSQFDRIKELHQQMYWAKDWTDQKINLNIANSQICYGVYDRNNKQIGFARIVTDYSTICYILDVVIDESYRDMGIGTKLMKTILENDDLKDCSFVLAASYQARNFYEHLGFEIKNDKYMLYRK